MALGKTALPAVVWAALGRLAAAGTSVTFYDCNAGLDDYVHLWTADQQLWRSPPLGPRPPDGGRRPGPRHPNGGPHPPDGGRRPGPHHPDGGRRPGPRPPTPGTYDCDSDFHVWDQAWSHSKKDWCCKKFGRACYDYDCSHDIFNSALWWERKSQWCCREKHLGSACQPRPATPGARHGAFHCHQDHPRTWPEQERQWCCQTHKLGCDVRQEYDCATDQATWKQSWSDEKKAWCCLNEGRGCSPYDCQHIGQMRTDSPKRRFCCEHEDIGCPYDCNIDLDVWDFAWSEDKRMWCCKRQQVACDAFNCHADPARAALWTPEKRSWCCSNRVPGIDCPTLV